MYALFLLYMGFSRLLGPFIICIAGSVELVDISAELPNLEYKNGLNHWKVIFFTCLNVKCNASSDNALHFYTLYPCVY